MSHGHNGEHVVAIRAIVPFEREREPTRYHWNVDTSGSEDHKCRRTSPDAGGFAHVPTTSYDVTWPEMHRERSRDY